MKLFNKKTFKIGSYTIVISAVVLAILIVANLIIGQLPSTVLQLDTTPNKLYDIGEETQKILENVNKEINVYMLVESGSEQAVQQIEGFILRYCELNSNIKYSTVDPGLYPNFSKDYTDETLSNGSVIVASDTGSTVIKNEDWFMYETEYGTFSSEEYQYYQQMGYFDGTDSYMFYGEQKLTNAIDRVNKDDLPSVYMLTGHGETELTSTFSGYLDDENIVTDSLTLITGDGTIPEECNIIMINTPTHDITELEKDSLISFFKAGGKIFLVTYIDSYNSADMPNLTALANEMGLAPVDGIIVEEDQNNYMQYPIYLVPNVDTASTITSNVTSGNLTCVVPVAHGITKAEDTSLTVYDLLATSEKSYLINDLDRIQTSYDKKDGDYTGSVDVAAASEDTANGGKFVWFASNTLINEQADYGGGNSVLFSGVATWLCDNQTDASISIIGNEIDTSYLVTTSAAVTVWNMVALVIIPACALIPGLYIWIKRRRQ